MVQMTKECPVCGVTMTRKRAYKRGRPSGWQNFAETCSRTCGGLKRRSHAAERFWAKVDTSSGLGACWPWTGCLSDLGYGRLGIEGKFQSAHRVAWAFVNNDGVMPDACVLHTCDNRVCCNPAHLWLGTQGDNMADMKAKGRRKNIGLGAENGRAVLNEDDVQVVRQRLRAGESQQRIADSYGINQTTISGIKIGRLWAHLPEA